MISDKETKRLHDKATRGLSLTAEEQSQLQNWYSLHDSIENKKLGLTTNEKKSVSLQNQIDTALEQLMTVTKRIQKVTSENQALKREVYLKFYPLAVNDKANKCKDPECSGS